MVPEGTRSAPLTDVGSSVTVIDSAEISREQRRTVPDALSLAPGLNVVQTGGSGGQASVFIRGTNSNQVKVLIDGIGASDPSNPNGSFDFGKLLTYDIDRIEVLRGPQSGLYGADAIGGVISITTKGGEGPLKAKALIEGGSFGTLNEMMGFSGATPVFSYYMNLAHFDVADTQVTPPELLPPGRQGIGNAYENWTLSTKFGAHLSDTLDASVVARYIDSTLRFTADDFSTFPATPAALQSSQRDNQLYTRGEANWSAFEGVLKNRFGLNYTQSDAGRKTRTRHLARPCQRAISGKGCKLIGRANSPSPRIGRLLPGSRTRTINYMRRRPSRVMPTRLDICSC